MKKGRHVQAFENLQWTPGVGDTVVARFDRFRIEVGPDGTGHFVAIIYDGEARLGRSTSRKQGTAVRGVIKLGLRYANAKTKCSECGNTLYPKNSLGGTTFHRCLNPKCDKYRKSEE